MNRQTPNGNIFRETCIQSLRINIKEVFDMKKLICLILPVFICVSVCAALAEEDGQNPVMNLIGQYMDEVGQRASMEILTSGTDGGSVSISWASSAYETTVWTFCGVFRTEDDTLQYANCMKINYIYDEAGNEAASVAYVNGTGLLTVNEDWSISWTDDQEDAGKDCRFVYTGGPVSTE